MVKKKSIDKKLYLYIGIVVLLALAGITYAYILEARLGSTQPYVTTGVLNITYTNEQNVINLTGALPQDDELGSSGTPYSFTLSNNTDIAVNYNFKLKTVCCTALVNGQCTDDVISPTILKYKLIDIDNSTNKVAENPSLNMLETRKILGEANGANSTDSYQLYVWISASATNSDLFTNNVGKKYCAKLEADAEQERNN